MGDIYSTATNANGVATWTYEGNSVGTDTIVASFFNLDQKEIFSNKASKKWYKKIPNVIPGLYVAVLKVGNKTQMITMKLTK